MNILRVVKRDRLTPSLAHKTQKGSLPQTAQTGRRGRFEPYTAPRKGAPSLPALPSSDGAVGSSLRLRIAARWRQCIHIVTARRVRICFSQMLPSRLRHIHHAERTKLPYRLLASIIFECAFCRWHVGSDISFPIFALKLCCTVATVVIATIACFCLALSHLRYVDINISVHKNMLSPHLKSNFSLLS